MAEIVCCGILFAKFEGGAILRDTMECAGFAGERLNEHADCHSGWESVGVDDDVGLYPGFCEWHVG
jgi:hypothetical protein